MGFSAGDAFVLGLSLFTAAIVYYKVRVPFKKKTMNIFTYLMLVLVMFALVGKSSHFIYSLLQCDQCFS